MDKKHKKTLLLVIAAAIIIATGIAYAYFRATVTRTNQTTRVTTGTLSLIFTDNSSVGFAEVIHFGDKRTTTFSIENNGTLDASASVYWKGIVNTFLPGSLVYTLKYGDENTEVSNYETIVDNGNVPTSSSAKDIVMLQNIEIPAGTTYNYILDIILVDSPTVNQTADLNASFYSEFTIKEYNYDGSKSLATLGLVPSISTPQNPGFGFNASYTSASAECSYNGYPVTTVNGTEETCGDVLESTLGSSFKYYDISYYNDLLAPMNATLEYVGEAVWDSVNETCTYNGETVYLLHPLLNDTPAQVEGKGKGCSQVYSIIDNNQNVIATGTGIKRVGPGTYGIVEQTSGIYSTEDDYGTSYYFRGNVTNNYVKFGTYPSDYKVYTSETCQNKPCESPTLELCEKANGVGNCVETTSSMAGSDIYWRIVRINGDGSLRLIYDGTSMHTNGETSTDRMALRNVPWDLTKDNLKHDVKYVGYMYGGSSGVASTSKEQAQRNETTSHMKEVLEAWYEKIFLETDFEQYISDEIFCNDRSIPTVAGELAPLPATPLIRFDTVGFGDSVTEYGANVRVQQNVDPTLECPQKNDAFTVNDTMYGNGKSKYPIGMITEDETRFAGLKSGALGTTDNYLIRSTRYWTISPCMYGNGSKPYLSIINQNNYITCYYQGGNTSKTALVPVINIGAEYIKNFIANEVSPGVIVYELQ